MPEIIIDNVKYKNVPNKKQGVAFGNRLTQSNIGMSQSVVDYINSNKFYTLVDAIDIDWNGVEIDENITLNTTSDLVNWLKTFQDTSELDSTVREIQEQVNALMLDKVSVGLSASISTIFVNSSNSIHLTATTDTEASVIAISKNNSQISTGSGNSLEYTDTVSVPVAGSISYVASFTVYGLTKTVTKNISVVNKIYYGAGFTYTDASNSPSAKTSPAGTYVIPIAANESYVFFNIPSNMNISKVTVSGFDMKFASPVLVTIDGVSYKSYKSENTYDAGSLTIVIQ